MSISEDVDPQISDKIGGWGNFSAFSHPTTQTLAAVIAPPPMSTFRHCAPRQRCWPSFQPALPPTGLITAPRLHRRRRASMRPPRTPMSVAPPLDSLSHLS
jgi:hypothetical protein